MRDDRKYPPTKEAPDTRLIPRQDIEFVIPDASLEAAKDALKTTSELKVALFPCDDPTSCVKTRKAMGGTHFHVEPRRGPGVVVPITVILMLQSDTLWFLPPLGASLINPKAETLPGYAALAERQTVHEPSDYSSDNAPVVVPKNHILLEAHMRLVARDEGRKGAENRLYYHNQILEAMGSKWNDINLDLMPQPFKAYYKAHKSGKMDLSDYIAGLKRTVGVPVDPEDFGLDPKKYGF